MLVLGVPGNLVNLLVLGVPGNLSKSLDRSLLLYYCFLLAGMWSTTEALRFCKDIVSASHSVMSDSLRPMDYNLSGCSIHGILQARILVWVAISLCCHLITEMSAFRGDNFIAYTTMTAPKSDLLEIYIASFLVHFISVLLCLP